MLAVLPFAVPLYRRKRAQGAHENAKMVRSKSILESDIIEYIQGISILKATNQVGKNAKNLRRGIIQVRDRQRSSVWGTTFYLVMADMLILLSLILITILGSIWVGQGTMSIAAISALLIIVSRLIELLSMFMAISGVLDVMDSGFARIKTILNTAPLKVVEAKQKISSNEIEFQNVDFTYLDQDEKTLNKMTFE